MKSSEIFLTPNELTKLASDIQTQMLEKDRELTWQNWEAFPSKTGNNDESTQLLSTTRSTPFVFRRPNKDDVEGIPDENGPPVLLATNKKVELPTDDEWEKRILRVGASIQKNIPSVGRIECLGNEMGTCFVISADLVLTNHHVIVNLFYSDGSPDTNKPVFVNFDEGIENDSKMLFRALYVVDKSSSPDFAILKIQPNGTSSLPPPLKLRQAPLTVNRNVELNSNAPYVYVIGYPGQGSPKNSKDKALEDKFFNGRYGAKTFAPGLLTKIVSGTTGSNSDINLLCSYNTLPGNSGSPVFDFDTGDVIGLHYGGGHRSPNASVPIWRIRDQIDKAIKAS